MLRMHDFCRVQAVIFIIACNINSAERAAFYFINELITTLDSSAQHIRLHTTLRLRIPRVFQAGEEAGAPCLAVARGASRVFHRNSLMSRQSATLADCVSFLLVFLSPTCSRSAFVS